MTRHSPDLRMPLRTEAFAPPPNRGRLMTAAQVAAELFCGTVSGAWVRRNVPYKIVLGHSTVRWWERDVLDWIAERRACVPTHPSTDC
jgi:hypothetical protein